MNDLDQKWQKEFARSERSNQDRPSLFKKLHLLNTLNMKPGDSITGKELDLFVRFVEEKGVKIPDKKCLTSTEKRNLSQSYHSVCGDLKPEITHASKLCPTDQALYDEFQRILEEGRKLLR